MQVTRREGELGLPRPVAELAAKEWDVIVVGGGHNGLAAAAYIARAGYSALVVERRHRVGGACTTEQPFDDHRYHISPCAYLVGLLHPLVIDELRLRRRGYRARPVDPHLWCPFEDGTAIALWDDPSRSAAAVAALAPADVDGLLRYQELFARIRRALRSTRRDTWIGPAPDRAEIESLLARDREAIEVLFEASIADVVERHVKDDRLRACLHGQGLIGTWAGPRDAGTAAIHAFHSMGSTEGRGGAWGYVDGGIGRISFLIAEAALEAGAEVACGLDVAAIHPGQGVDLAGGERLKARVVVSNADPKRTLDLCAEAPPAGFAARVRQWRAEGPVVKLNCGLSRLPSFPAAGACPADEGALPHRAMVTITGTIDETQAGYEASRTGQAAPVWCELYFPTAYDPGLAPPGRHVMSVFAQYAPYTLASGSWEERREAIADQVVSHVARYSPDIAELIVERQVLGPPDIEASIGLTGGHIFQGECLPEQMWDRRFGPRTPFEGLYLCGAATHPGGSVIAINGRNAATAVLEDLGPR